MTENPNPMLPASSGRADLPASEVRLGFDTKDGMDALLRAANLLANSTLVPATYRKFNVDKQGNATENPSGLPNCAVALNMASRMGADPLMIMQNMHVIEGRPSWSSPFIVASVNQCGRFSPLRFEMSRPGEEVEVEYSYVEWEDGQNGKRRPVDKIGKVKIRHQTCVAWAVEKATGERLESPTVSMQMAVDEGWVQKKGSKWRTMPEVMLRYRSASFFGRLYAPELLMGLQSQEEAHDIQDVEVLHEEATTGPRGTLGGQSSTAGSLAWPIPSLERFDRLLDEAYAAFKDAGMVEHWPVFEGKWRPRRGKADDMGTLRDLAEEVAKLTPQDATPE